jgi:RNA polymerase sigma-70 factor (ECF subfamily)
LRRGIPVFCGSGVFTIGWTSTDGGESAILVDNGDLQEWFCNEVLPLERALTTFIRRNWREVNDVVDIRQEIYERALIGAQAGVPHHTSGYLYTVARNHLANRARRAKIVSFDVLADLDSELPGCAFEPEPALIARDELRHALRGLEQLPPRCREVVQLRKIEGLSTREVAERMGIGIDTVEKQLTLGIRALTDFMLGGSGKIQRQGRIGLRRKLDLR